jgi:uncharacterized membrane protein YcgQ (UPF0703/DUF1980 family)
MYNSSDDTYQLFLFKIIRGIIMKKVTLTSQVQAATAGITAKLGTLQSKKENALNIFRSTAADLDSINKEIDENVAMLDEQIKAFTDVKTQMLKDKTSNENIRSKIADFLS